MQGTVQKIEFTKNGSKKLQINGTWYFAGRCNVDDLKAGDHIEFEFSEFGEDRGRGRPRGLDNWKPAPQDRRNSSSSRSDPVQTITDVDVLRSISNVVGSACAAGTIKDPVELEKWFCAAWAGLTRRQRSASGVDPDLNDRIPGENDEREDPRPAGVGFQDW